MKHDSSIPPSEFLQRRFNTERPIMPNENDAYEVAHGYEIEWTGNGETFVVNRHYFDRDVGHVSDTDLFMGSLSQCADFIAQKMGIK